MNPSEKLYIRTYRWLFFIFALSAFIFSSCSSLKMRCWREGYVQHDTTYFPAPQLDFSPSPYQARLAIPDNNSQIRIWVKGNQENRYVQLFDPGNLALGEPVQLVPPFYTATINAPIHADSIVVKFGNQEDNLKDSNNKKVIHTAKIKAKEPAFSFLFYGCFQPFHVGDDGNPLLLHNASNPLNYQMRQLFEDVGLEKELKFYPAGRDTLITGTMLSNPLLVIGTGDQVYVDAGYETRDFRDHALTGWAHSCKDPYPLLDNFSYLNHLDRCYRNFYSFRFYDKVFARLPSLNVWDDHEIRDGWGSHGDEYILKTGKMAGDLRPYFNFAKQAYIEHQYALGTKADTDELISGNKSLEQKIEINGVPIFAFDLRSHRDIHRNRVLDEGQMEAFRDWCQKVEEEKEVMIISSMPFFYKPNKPFNLLGRIFKPGLRDDINDGWYSKYNRGQRNEILQEIIKLRNRNVQPIIISGDAHMGGMISAWYKKPDSSRQRLCYEFIFSGLSHESLGEERSGYKITFRRRSDGRRVNDPTFPIGEYHVDYIYEFIEGRLNFGGIQFEEGKKTIASLFIVGDDEDFLTERELVLEWDENFEEYLDQAQLIKRSSYAPPELTIHKIVRYEN
jgi:hypothetical protein